MPFSVPQDMLVVRSHRSRGTQTGRSRQRRARWNARPIAGHYFRTPGQPLPERAKVKRGTRVLRVCAALDQKTELLRKENRRLVFAILDGGVPRPLAPLRFD